MRARHDGCLCRRMLACICWPAVRALVFGAVFVTVLATAQQAEASEELRPGAHQPIDHLVVGVKGVSTVEQARVDGHTLQLTGYGVAGVAERTLFHDRMSLELDFVFTTPGDETSLAIEPMTKLPWHINRHLEPYAATGPVILNIADGQGAHYWLGGGQFVFGALIWFVEQVGIDVDLAFAAARGTGMTMYEATFAVGPMLRD